MEGSRLVSYFHKNFLKKCDTAEANYATDPLDADELEKDEDKGILIFSLDGSFTGAASSEAKDPEMDKERHTNVEEDMDIDTNAEKDMGMDKGTHTIASDQQFIDAASSTMKSSKESSDTSLDQGASFEEKNDMSIDGERFQLQEVIGNSVEQVASVAQGRARRERKRKLTDYKGE